MAFTRIITISEVGFRKYIPIIVLLSNTYVWDNMSLGRRDLMFFSFNWVRISVMWKNKVVLTICLDIILAFYKAFPFASICLKTKMLFCLLLLFPRVSSTPVHICIPFQGVNPKTLKDKFTCSLSFLLNLLKNVSSFSLVECFTRNKMSELSFINGPASTTPWLPLLS